MKIAVDTSLTAARKWARQWRLSDLAQIATTSRATVYKAHGVQGAVALKLYNEIGAKGESAATLFLRNLTAGAGPTVYHTNWTRTAICMEWLEGPTLDNILAEGDEDKAVANLAIAAKYVAQTPFRFAFLYRPIAPKYIKDFKALALSAPSPDVARVAALLDQLVATTKHERVIHGDLWFGNVVLTPQGPKLFDPKGFYADPAYEFCKVLAPDFQTSNIADYVGVIRKRAATLAPVINADPQRLIAWGAVAKAHRVLRRDHADDRQIAEMPFLRAYLAAAENT